MSREQPREFGALRECPEAPVLQVPPCCDTHRLFCEEAWAAIADTLELSVRQAQIARLVVADRGDDQIARVLGLSWSTIQTHMERLHEKLDVHSRVQVVTRVVAAYLTWRAESPPPTGCRVKTRLESL